MQGYLSGFHRVYLVDDHDILRRGVRDLLISARDIAVVGDSGSVREAVPAILGLEPDVMLLDLHLQDGTGIEICRAVRAVKPSICALLFTAAGDDEAMAATVLAGAAGYLIKAGRSSLLTGAIRDVQPGTTLMDEGSVQRASRLLRSIAESLTPTMTEAERLALARVVDGQTDSQISEALATDDGPRDADIVELVARVSEALLGAGTSSGARSNGRHRLPD